MDENYRNIMEDTCIDRENGKSLSQQENSLTEYNAHNGEAPIVLMILVKSIKPIL